MAADPPLFALTDAAKSYAFGRTVVEAIRGVDLRVDDGEMIALAGPSGSGKTTLLNLLGTLDRPDRGRVEHRGVDLGALDEGRRTLLRRRHLGFVFQDFALVPVLTALENVEYPLAIDGVPRRERRERALGALERVGLADRGHHRPDRLSGGQRQRVAIARAVVHEPEAILADEPTGNLDSATAGQIVDLLVELNATRGTTLVVATHDPALVARLPRRVHLVDGRIASDEREDRGEPAPSPAGGAGTATSGPAPEHEGREP